VSPPFRLAWTLDVSGGFSADGDPRDPATPAAADRVFELAPGCTAFCWYIVYRDVNGDPILSGTMNFSVYTRDDATGLYSGVNTTANSVPPQDARRSTGLPPGAAVFQRLTAATLPGGAVSVDCYVFDQVS